MMVDASSEKGAIDEQEKEFIQNVFEFDDLTAREIAVHRTDVLCCGSKILWKNGTKPSITAVILFIPFAEIPQITLSVF